MKESRKVRLGLDVDGVLYRFQDTAIYLLETHRGAKLSYDEWSHWDYPKDKITGRDWKWLWSEAITNHGLFRYGSIFKGSREFLTETAPYCDNIVITSRPSEAVQDTLDWLAYQKLPTAEIHILGSNQSKSKVKPRCDIYIDDATHNAQDLLERTTGKIILPDRPWNQDAPVSKRVFRTKNWNEVKEIILETHKEINGND